MKDCCFTIPAQVQAPQGAMQRCSYVERNGEMVESLLRPSQRDNGHHDRARPFCTADNGRWRQKVENYRVNQGNKKATREDGKRDRFQVSVQQQWMAFATPLLHGFQQLGRRDDAPRPPCPLANCVVRGVPMSSLAHQSGGFGWFSIRSFSVLVHSSTLHNPR